MQHFTGGAGLTPPSQRWFMRWLANISTYYWGVAARTRRIEVRADPVSEERISRAARARDLSVSAFVSAAATHEADRLLSRADQTLIPAGQFDALVAALDQSDPAPRLEGAARSPRLYRRA